jgi:cyclohexyl-isocyanide hydratase
MSSLQIGALIFPEIDQLDFTGPFEVLSQLPDSTFHVLWKDTKPIRDGRGLWLTPNMTLDEAPQLDLLIVPGGYGQLALMTDEAVLAFLQRQAAKARHVLSVCTGALTCGAAGLLRDRRATTHWSAFHLLRYFGAIPVDARVVIDGTLVSAAGVTSGIDGALTAAALLAGEAVAQEIQLYMQYAPEPPFQSGSPASASARVLEAARTRAQPITEARERVARSIAEKLGIKTTPGELPG